MTSVGFQPAFGCAPQFGLQRRDDAQQGVQQQPDLRSQRLYGGAKLMGISALLGVAASVVKGFFSTEQLIKFAGTKGGMALLAGFGIVNWTLGLAGLVQVGRGLFTKSGQSNNQPAQEAVYG